MTFTMPITMSANDPKALLQALHLTHAAEALPAWLERAAHEEALAAGDVVETTRQDAAARARRAFAAYVRADREYRLHVEHVGLASRVVDLARSLYQVGHGAQQDLLHAQAELSRLHVEVVGIEQQRRSAQALLNALMDRDPDAALGPAPDAPAAEAGPRDVGPVDAAERLGQRRPDLRAAARSVKRSEALVDVARREATLPALMVGADYWYMPTLPSHHAYGAMVSMSLPWLNSGRPAEVTAAERTSVAERNALRSRLVTARFELKDAELKLRAARETLALLQAGVLADAKRNFEAAQAQFQSGRGDVTPVLDAARSYLEVRIEEIRALAEVASSQADYARAAGLPVVEMAAGHEGRR